MSERFLGVDQKFLDIAGLNQGTLREFTFDNRAELTDKFEEGKDWGRNLFTEKRIEIPYTDNILNELKIHTIQLPQSEVDQIPDLLMGEWQEARQTIHIRVDDFELIDALDTFINDALEGFALESARKSLWQAVVNAYDVIAKGDLENSEGLKKIIQDLPLHRKDFAARLEIARAMEKRTQSKLQPAAPTPGRVFDPPSGHM